MSDDSRRDRAVSTLSRRHAIAAGATLLTAGGTIVWVGDPVSAAVSVDSFNVSDATFERESLTPRLDVTAAYAYDAAFEPVADLRFEVGVDGTVIDTDTLVTDAGTLDADTSLSGLVTDSDAWSASDFSPDAGESVSHDLSVTLRFAVRESDGTVIVEDEAADTASVTVTNPSDGGVTATVGGTGTISHDG